MIGRAAIGTVLQSSTCGLSHLRHLLIRSIIYIYGRRRQGVDTQVASDSSKQPASVALGTCPWNYNLRNMASRIRRKPQITYKSPSAEDHAFISLSLAYPRNSSASSTTKSTQLRTSPDEKPHALQNPTRPRYSAIPSLPLFHPFGRLAMSLPPLDPTRYGLPMPAIAENLQTKSSSRVRRPAAKVREVENEAPAISSSVSTIAAVAAREVKERPSPRKRRAGGAKRKRKDADDGDATYPAKRTRNPRGAAGPGDEESLVDGLQMEEVEIPSPPDALPDLSDAAAKRRSTRARGSLKRRDSSGSEATSISGSANVLPEAGNAAPPEISAPEDTEIAHKSDDPSADPLIGNDDKEEGELSEEHLATT